MNECISILRFYLSWVVISTLIIFISPDLKAYESFENDKIKLFESKFENLWSLSLDMQPSYDDASVYQIMLAIQDLNKSAFEKNNINYLKRTSILELPEANFISSFDKQESIFEVARQNSLVNSKFTFFSILEPDKYEPLPTRNKISFSQEDSDFFYEDNKDPYEKFNRKIHDFNTSLDEIFFKPAAEIYASGTPEFLQIGVSNVFGNLGDASSAANNILQLKPKAFLKDFSRFIINSTMGIYGIFDIASEMGIEGTNEDFGQTLGHWGVSPGPYVVIPFYGPSNFRDSFSIIPDLYLYPNVPSDDSARIATGALNLLDLRSDLLGVTEITGNDQYTFYRDAYIQRREYQINDGQIDEEFIFDEFD